MMHAMCIYTYIYIYIYTYVCACVYIYICICIYINTHTCLHKHICMHTSMIIYMYTCSTYTYTQKSGACFVKVCTLAFKCVNYADCNSAERNYVLTMTVSHIQMRW